MQNTAYPDSGVSGSISLSGSFWPDLICGNYEGKPERLAADSEALGISKTGHLPLLIAVKQWNRRVSWREKYNLLSLTEECIRSLFPTEVCLRIDENRLMLIFDSPCYERINFSELVAACSSATLCDIACCVGEAAGLSEIPHICDFLIEMDAQNVSGAPLLYLHKHSRNKQKTESPDMKEWMYLLSEERFDALLMEITDYFFSGSRNNVSMELLYKFNQDFIQLLYIAMREKGVPAHVLFNEKNSSELFRESPASVAGTLLWIFSAVTEFSNYLENDRKSKDYIQQAKDFILLHLNTNFSRSDIAEHVHLSQNHLARIFKRETGIGISDYIIQERMKMALELLENTSLSVGEVALRTGYENYSYFLTLFRKVAGMRPSEYRDKRKKC